MSWRTTRMLWTQARWLEERKRKRSPSKSHWKVPNLTFNTTFCDCESATCDICQHVTCVLIFFNNNYGVHPAMPCHFKQTPGPSFQRLDPCPEAGNQTFHHQSQLLEGRSMEMSSRHGMWKSTNENQKTFLDTFGKDTFRKSIIYIYIPGNFGALQLWLNFGDIFLAGKKRVDDW